jgi:hypothetical protein
MESLRSGDEVWERSEEGISGRDLRESPAGDDPDQTALAMEQGQATPPAAPTFKL